MMSEEKIAREIDTSGLNCPLPILRAKKALAELHSGDLLKVIATDMGSLRDFPAFAAQTGHALVAQHTQDDGRYIFVLRKR